MRDDLNPRLPMTAGESAAAPSSTTEIMATYNKWLTIDELAGHIKMSRTKLYGMAQRGEVPALKIGNQWHFDREEIGQSMKAHATGRGSSKA